MMRRILPGLTAPAVLATAVFATLAAGVPVAALGDTLDVPAGNSAANALPRRGSTMERVEERFGAPVRIIDAIGDPPITRWVYDNFTVYFEFDRVIHPVMRTSQTGHGVTATAAP